MNIQLAKVFSYLFHPSIIPSFLFGIILLGYTPIFPVGLEGRLYILGFTFLFTFVFPAIIVYFLYKSDVIKSITMENREDRLLPFTIATVFYTWTTYLLISKLGMAIILTTIMGSIALTLGLVTLITLFHKISAHAVGISGITGVFFSMQLVYPEYSFFLPILFSVFASGLLLTSRLALNAHNPLQVLSGFILGFSICYGYVFLLG